MPRLLRTALACGLALLLNACSNVYVPAPIGERPLDIEPEKQEWAGNWFHRDGAITVQVVDGPKGVLRLGWIEEVNDKLELKLMEVFLRDSGGWTYASVRDPDAKGEELYVWARLEKLKGSVTLWFPNARSFRDLVNAGKLPGTVKGNNVHLGELQASHLDALRTGQLGVPFEWESPAVFFRQGR